MTDQNITYPQKRWHVVPGYLSGPLYDSILIFGVLFVALFSGAIVVARPELFPVVFILDIWLLGYHHVIATFTKLAGTPEDRRENHFLIWYLPVIVLAGTIGLYFTLGIWAIVTVYFFWQWYHYTRQAYGISVFYRKKSGLPKGATPDRLEHAALWAFPIWGLTHRCAQGWDQFLFQDFWTPSLPMEASALVGSLAVIIVGMWIFTKIFDLRNGHLSFCSLAFMVSHHIVFFVGYILIGDITIGWLVANVWHNAQYILFVWLFNQNRFAKDPESGAIADKTNSRRPRIMPWLSQPKPYRILAYFAFCLVMTSVFYGSITSMMKLVSAGDMVLMTGLTVIAYQTINFHHYIVDAMIWKARKKSHQKIMKLKG